MIIRLPSTKAPSARIREVQGLLDHKVHGHGHGLFILATYYEGK
jgi:hypothetical protein